MTSLQPDLTSWRVSTFMLLGNTRLHQRKLPRLRLAAVSRCPLYDAAMAVPRNCVPTLKRRFHSQNVAGAWWFAAPAYERIGLGALRTDQHLDGCRVPLVVRLAFRDTDAIFRSTCECSRSPQCPTHRWITSSRPVLALRTGVADVDTTVTVQQTTNKSMRLNIEPTACSDPPWPGEVVIAGIGTPESPERFSRASSSGFSFLQKRG